MANWVVAVCVKDELVRLRLLRCLLFCCCCALLDRLRLLLRRRRCGRE